MIASKIGKYNRLEIDTVETARDYDTLTQKNITFSLILIFIIQRKLLDYPACVTINSDNQDSTV